MPRHNADINRAKYGGSPIQVKACYFLKLTRPRNITVSRWHTLISRRRAHAICTGSERNEVEQQICLPQCGMIQLGLYSLLSIKPSIRSFVGTTPSVRRPAPGFVLEFSVAAHQKVQTDLSRSSAAGAWHWSGYRLDVRPAPKSFAGVHRVSGPFRHLPQFVFLVHRCHPLCDPLIETSGGATGQGCPAFGDQPMPAASILRSRANDSQRRLAVRLAPDIQQSLLGFTVAGRRFLEFGHPDGFERPPGRSCRRCDGFPTALHGLL